MTNVLFVVLMWLPLDGAVEGSVTADYFSQTLPTAEACDTARAAKLELMWSSKPGHRLLSYKTCTDGTAPTNVRYGQFSVVVDSTVEGDGG